MSEPTLLTAADLTSNPSISLFNLTRLHASIGDEITEAMNEVIRSSSFIGGPVVQRFETDFAAYQGASHTVGCGSGTDALSLALRALGIGPGDEVIVPAMTFVATAEAVFHVGATPVIVDVDPATLLIDPAAVEAARTEATRAILPVHLYGQLVPAQTIESWKAGGLIVIEDTAQAHGAEYPDRPGFRAGSIGDAACFSFYPGKNLGGYGDGGAVVTNRLDVADTMISLRNHGRKGKFDHDVVGYCTRLDTLQAAILGAKLRHLDRWNELRRDVARTYDDVLVDHPALAPLSMAAGSVYHQYVLRVDGDRNAFRDDLDAVGVTTGTHYPQAISEYSAYRDVSRDATHAVAAAACIASLPMDPLLDAEELERVCDAIRTWRPC